MNEQNEISKKHSLLFWIMLVAVVMSAAGYVRLYILIAKGVITLPFESSLASVTQTTAINQKVFGYSTQGKAIEGYEIGDGENAMLLFSSIHGDEVGTTDLLNELIKEINNNPSMVSKTKKLVIIPIANPDGYYDRTDKLNANGVNLNLNFATSDWKQYGPEGTYAGAKAFSDIESQVLKDVVEEHKPEMMISYHASGALVTPENSDASIALGKWYAEKTGYGYYDDKNLDWDYPGTATKWFVETTSKPAITVELTTYRGSDWEINKKALLELISSDNN